MLLTHGHGIGSERELFVHLGRRGGEVRSGGMSRRVRRSVQKMELRGSIGRGRDGGRERVGGSRGDGRGEGASGGGDGGGEGGGEDGRDGW